jgi:hypothetical protein
MCHLLALPYRYSSRYSPFTLEKNTQYESILEEQGFGDAKYGSV